jgi:hypothetical protein
LQNRIRCVWHSCWPLTHCLPEWMNRISWHSRCMMLLGCMHVYHGPLTYVSAAYVQEWKKTLLSSEAWDLWSASIIIHRHDPNSRYSDVSVSFSVVRCHVRSILSISGTNKVKVEQGKEIGYISPKASQ